jgi:hypothetical protein
MTDARIHARSSFVVGRKNKNTHHQGTKTPREDSQGGRGGKGEKIITTEITEDTEGRYSPKRRGGKMLQMLEAKMCPCALSVHRETIANAAAQRTGHNRPILHGA